MRGNDGRRGPASLRSATPLPLVSGLAQLHLHQCKRRERAGRVCNNEHALAIAAGAADDQGWSQRGPLRAAAARGAARHRRVRLPPTQCDAAAQLWRVQLLRQKSRSVPVMYGFSGRRAAASSAVGVMRCAGALLQPLLRCCIPPGWRPVVHVAEARCVTAFVRAERAAEAQRTSLHAFSASNFRARALSRADARRTADAT